jgi:hypothetical protein
MIARDLKSLWIRLTLSVNRIEWITDIKEEPVCEPGKRGKAPSIRLVGGQVARPSSDKRGIVGSIPTRPTARFPIFCVFLHIFYCIKKHRAGLWLPRGGRADLRAQRTSSRVENLRPLTCADRFKKQSSRVTGCISGHILHCLNNDGKIGHASGTPA